MFFTKLKTLEQARESGQHHYNGYYVQIARKHSLQEESRLGPSFWMINHQEMILHLNEEAKWWIVPSGSRGPDSHISRTDIGPYSTVNQAFVAATLLDEL